MKETSVGKIRIVLAALTYRQHELAARMLEMANADAKASGDREPFEFAMVEERGFSILESAADADVVILGLDDDVLPGEASHLVAAFADVSIIGVDHRARPCVVLESVDEPVSSDLPTFIRWIARRNRQQGLAPSKRSL